MSLTEAFVALRPLKAGGNVYVTWAGFSIDVMEDMKDIPMGHKIALHEIHAEDKIIKYGFPIGCALSDIHKGFHIHTHASN